METDLLARVCAEIEQRLAELRPLLDEYERLLEAADTLASIEAAPNDSPPPTASEPRRAVSRRGAGDRPKIGQRGSAAGAIEPAASAPQPSALEPEPEPTPPTPRAPRILPGMPSLRTQPGPRALPGLSTPAAQPAPTQAPPQAQPALPEPVVEELEPEPEPVRKPAAPSDVRQAIIAALEHGSHTISELVMVTAMSTPEIRTNLSQLARQRKITRVKRQGDGKSAFALPASSAHS